MAAETITVPLDTIVPISKFGHAGASSEFAKVEDDTPVTVLRNGEPTYSSSTRTTTASTGRRS